MPPRKRARRSSGGTAGADPPRDTSTPASTPARPGARATQRAASAATMAIVAPAPTQGGARYRTRHRREVRGPDVAAREGGEDDLVPPSDDDEYDVWRDVRAVERVQRAERTATEGSEDAGAGPSRFRGAGSSSQSNSATSSSSPAPVPAPWRSAGQHSFVLSPSPTASTQSTLPLPSLSPRFVPLFSPPGSRSLSPSSSAPSSPRVPYTLSARDKGKRRADFVTTPTPSPSFHTAPPTSYAPLAVHLGSPKPFAMPPPSSARTRDRLPSTSASRSASPADVPLAAGPPPDPPPRDDGASVTVPSSLSQRQLEVYQVNVLDDVGVDVDMEDRQGDGPIGSSADAAMDSDAVMEESQRPLTSLTAPARDVPSPPSSPWGMDLDVLPSPHSQNVEESQLPLAPAPPTPEVAAPTPSPPREPASASQRPTPPASDAQAFSLSPSPVAASLSARPILASSSPVPPASSRRLLPPSSPAPAAQPLDDLAATPVRAPQGSMGPPQPPSSSPDAVGLFGAASARRVSPVAPPPAALPSSPAISADPALLQFRFMRTFRTRTALQLQPYTRERQLYDNMLRRGGLAKGRRGVAPSAEVRANADEAGTAEKEGESTASSDEDATPPDAIVIGATQENARQPRPPRKTKPLIDADYDEYFLRFGEVADEEDDLAANRLQDIARERLRKDKDARRAQREAERTRRAFEALIKGANKDPPAEKPKSRDTAKAARPTKAPRNNKETDRVPPRRREPGKKTGATPVNGRSRVVTYGRRQPRAPFDSDSSLSSAPPSPGASPRMAPIPLSSPPRAGVPPTSSPPQQALPPPSPLANDPFPDFDFGGWDVDNDPATPAPAPNSGAAPSTTASRTKRRRVVESSSQSSDADDSDAAAESLSPQQDKRRRIAGRMLPAVMLRRMELEEQERRRRRAEAQRRARASHSPVRPGHAVVRRRAGGALDMGGLFDESDDDSDTPAGGMHAIEAEEGDESDASDGSLGHPVVLSSDSSGSEAMEDNGRPGALARLQRGDFESLVHGRQAEERGGVARDRERERKHRDGDSHRKQRPRRPALGLAKRVRAPDRYDEYERRVPDESRLYQTRLDFPADTSVHKSARKAHKRTTSGGHARSRRPGGKSTRPAIRLDDRVIFATGDFAFDSDSDDIEITCELPAPTPPPAVPGPRPLARVVSARGGRLHVGRSSSPVPRPAPTTRARNPRRQLDEGVGKARSWANFERFPVDFEITPLPTGVSCDIDALARGAPLTAFIAALDGAPHREPKPCSAFGVDLHVGMDVDEALAVLPIVVDGVFTAVSDGAESDLRPLWFFRDYLGHMDVQDRPRVFTQLGALSQRLDGLALTNSKAHRAFVLQVLRIRYTLLESAAVTGPDQVGAAATALVSLLLTYGFDRTVRPLRRILRGRASTPQVDDVSIALWVSLLHILAAHDRNNPPSTGSTEDTFTRALSDALDKRFRGEIGPLAAERIWFLVFGLCALGQFGADGAVMPEYTPYPRWQLVRRALGLIRVAHSQEAEEAAHHDQLQGRDRYIKTMVARCLRLSSAWRWSFDASSFSVATRDLGMIFKERQHRNLPSEPPAEFPAFITQFDISLTASDDTRRASAFELWLRLACVAASDVIGAAEELSEAHRAVRDVQRLIMSIFPLSAFPFSRAHPPSRRQLGALVNRYSTMVVACYFSPALLPWLIANSLKWLAFDTADFESRQVCIRGLMYLAVACRHHSQPLDAVVARLADILATLQAELEQVARPTKPPNFPTRVEIERTMVLVVSCFRQIIMHPGYAPRPDPVYPDPTLLHESWTSRIFQLDFVQDVKSGLEIVSTIQAFLDARAAALPGRAKAARRERQTESLDDYPSLGFDFDDVDLAALGGDEAPEDPVERQDAAFANIILTNICPRIYRLLSDMLPAVAEAESADTPSAEARSERLVFINKLTQCWSDCAAVVVVEHRLQDWSVYVGAFGQQSWARLGNDLGRVQVGLQFMLNVAHLDPGAFRTHEEEFLSLLFQTLVTDALTVEHKYAAAVFALPGALDHALFEGLRGVGVSREDMTRTGFMTKRLDILKQIFGNMPLLVHSRFTPAEMKTQIYRYANVLVGAMALYEAGIDARRVLHRQGYRVFCADVVRVIKQVAGDVVTPASVPALKALGWV